MRLLNRDYYHRNREHIVQQQRDRRARDRQTKEGPFRKLRALADVCAARLLEIQHGYARIEPTPQKEGPRAKQTESKTVSATTVCGRERHRESESPQPSTLPRTYGADESQRGVRELQGQKGPGGHATLLWHVGGAAQ